MKDTTELNAEEAIRMFSPGDLHRVAGGALCVLLIAIDTYRTCASRACRGCREGLERKKLSDGPVWHESLADRLEGHYCNALFSNQEIERLTAEMEKVKNLL